MTRTDTITLRVDPNVRARLELVANEDGTTVAAILRDLIDDHIEGRHTELGRYSRLLSRVTPPRGDAGQEEAEKSASNSRGTTFL